MEIYKSQTINHLREKALITDSQNSIGGSLQGRAKSSLNNYDDEPFFSIVKDEESIRYQTYNADVSQVNFSLALAVIL